MTEKQKNTTQRKGGTQQVDWSDDSIKGGGYLERPDTYKGKQGFTDIIRLLTNPISVIYVKIDPGNGKGFSTPTLAAHQDVMDGWIDGNDKDARARAMKECPALAKGYTPTRRFVCLVWHGFRVNRKGQRKAVNQALPMIFDGGKFEMIRSIHGMLPIKTGTNKRKPFHLVELQVACTDTQFQKMNFSLMPTVTQKWDQILPKIQELFPNGFSRTAECSLIEDVVEAETYQSLSESLNRVESRGSKGSPPDDDSDNWSDDGEEEDADENPKRRQRQSGKQNKANGKTNKQGKVKKPKDDDDEELAEELTDALDDEDLSDYEEDEEGGEAADTDTE